MPSSRLEVENLTMSFAGLVALRNLTLVIEPGETVGIIGPNGAGKSTLLNCVTRYYQPTRGILRFDGRDLLAVKRHDICRLGIARTFQNLELFEPQSVAENVRFGGISRVPGHAWRSPRRAATIRRELHDEADEILAWVRLDGDADRPVTDLPYADRKRVEFARAMMARPHLLFLDEPTSGMGLEDSQAFARLVQEAKDRRDLTVAVIAHDMPFVFGLCDRVLALNGGELLAEGTPREVRTDPEVVRVYLGEESAA